ncbi:hypothetical protein GCM10009000_031740 [Halobacterium noricense]
MERPGALVDPPTGRLDGIAVARGGAALALDELDDLAVLHVDGRDHLELREVAHVGACVGAAGKSFVTGDSGRRVPGRPRPPGSADSARRPTPRRRRTYVSTVHTTHV